MPKKIFILLAHPDKDTYSGALASIYEEGARESGHDVSRMNIGDMQFNPVLHKGYKTIQQLEPDLVLFQKNVTRADHVVIIYPNWWNTMPAILKGLFDRAWLPSFAFNFDKKTGKLIQHFKGKTARVIIVCGTQSPFKTRVKYGDFKNEIERGILRFAGLKTAVTAFGPSERVSDKVRRSWLQKVRALGIQAK